MDQVSQEKNDSISRSNQIFFRLLLALIGVLVEAVVVECGAWYPWRRNYFNRKGSDKERSGKISWRRMGSKRKHGDDEGEGEFGDGGGEPGPPILTALPRR